VARIRAAGPILVVACLLWSGWAPGARGADAIDAELIGFLAQIPRDGLRLPPPAPATATLEVPNEQGGPRIVFPLEFTPRTGPGRARLVRPGDLVLLEGVIQGGRMRVTQVRDVEIAEFKGRLSLPDGPLSLPLAADRLVDVVLEGARVPIGFLITPRTTGPRTTLRDGQSVALAVVVSGRIVIDLDPR
jgi:hypothetical protein